MHVIIGGCGRVGAEIADQLSGEGHDVVVLDLSQDAFDRIGSAFDGETLTGDITDKDALARAGIERADALAAVTDFDNANLMAVQIASELFDVRHTVARLFNPEREESYRKMGVRYVSGTRLVAKAILNELQAGSFPTHITFEEGDIEALDMRVERDGHGMTVAELERGGAIRVAAIRRGMRVRIPKLDDRLHMDDVVVAAVSERGYGRLRGVMAHPLAKRA
ncbi:MAG TPA: TrkA family potassium uptake protein [Egibacteraceae bacterium]|nr:TrkA family potassium uptake protein [Egibacteraceae bacterium]